MGINIKGYLVVLVNAIDASDFVKGAKLEHYKGVYRRPTFHMAYIEPDKYPHPYYYEAEKYPMDLWVSSKYVDPDKDVILTKEKAIEYLNLFKFSPREFELIYIESVDDDSNSEHYEREGEIFLGYDVAQVGGPFESYLLFAGAYKEFSEYYNKLNQYGLFSDYNTAKSYWEYFKQLKWWGWDDEVTIYKVYIVQLK